MSSPGVDFTTNPQFQQMWNMFKPMAQQGIGAATSGQPLWPAATVGKPPTPIEATGLYTGTPSWQMPQLSGYFTAQELQSLNRVMEREGRTRTKPFQEAMQDLNRQVSQGEELDTAEMRRLLQQYKPDMLSDFNTFVSDYEAARTKPGLSYDIPSIEPLMPTADWWEGLSPEFKEGIFEPYRDQEEQLKETLNSLGQLGNQRAGVSGTGAAGLGKFWAEAMPNIYSQAWQSYYPPHAAQWNEELVKNKQLQYMDPREERTLSWGQRATEQERQWQGQMMNAQMLQQALAAPWTFGPQMFGAASSGLSANTVASPGGFNWSSLIGPALALTGQILGGPIGGQIGAGFGNLFNTGSSSLLKAPQAQASWFMNQTPSLLY